MPCKSKKCDNYESYHSWENFKLDDVKNPYNFCDTDLMPSMPDSCSRCKRAYHDYFREV